MTRIQSVPLGSVSCLKADSPHQHFVLPGEELCQMSPEGVVMVKKEGEITFGRRTSMCKGLEAQEIWQEMKLLRGPGSAWGKGLGKPFPEAWLLSWGQASDLLPRGSP